MDVFSFHAQVVEVYGKFSRGFTQITLRSLRQLVDGRYGVPPGVGHL
jgi:hypothetical protein